jgi:hypothetical protein
LTGRISFQPARYKYLDGWKEGLPAGPLPALYRAGIQGYPLWPMDTCQRVWVRMRMPGWQETAAGYPDANRPSLTLKHEYFIYIQYGLCCGTEGETGYSSGTGRMRVTDGKRSNMNVAGREEREKRMAWGYIIPTVGIRRQSRKFMVVKNKNQILFLSKYVKPSHTQVLQQIFRSLHNHPNSFHHYKSINSTPA